MEDNSMRSIGVKYIPVDKVTKANLQRLARLEGKPLGYYLRDFAEKELSGKSIPLDTVSPGSGSPDLNRLCTQAVQLSQYIPMSESRRLAAVSFADQCMSCGSLEGAQRLYSQMREEFDKYEAKVRAIEGGQSEFEFELA